MLGRLHITGKLTSVHFAVAKRWAELVSEHAAVCQCPVEPKSKTLDPTGGKPIDPDSPAGIKEARRHASTTRAYLDARNTLRLAGSAAEAAVDSVVIQDKVPVGLAELEALRHGLQSLATWWSSTKRKAVR